MKVVAILACHNRRERTVSAIRSLHDQAWGGELTVVLVDDGSSDGTAAAVQEQFPATQILRGDGSLFWAAAMALGERAALDQSPDAVLWLNDDVTLTPTALELLARASLGTTPPAVVAGVVADPDSGHASYGGLEVSRWHPLRTELLEPTGEAESIDTFNGNVVWVPIEASQAIGRIDGAFAHAYADNDYGLRLKKIGYPIVNSPTFVGTCSRRSSSRRASATPGTLRHRWAELNSPRQLPIRSQMRFFHRHGPRVIWPVYALAPYVRAIRRPRPDAGAGETPT